MLSNSQIKEYSFGMNYQTMMKLHRIVRTFHLMFLSMLKANCNRIVHLNLEKS